jgi:Domain of unknown function (DUF4149)
MNNKPSAPQVITPSRNWKDTLALFATALWWGSLTAVGFMVVPQLFANLETPAIAGRMAAKLFSTQTWLSCACALVLLMAARAKHADEGEEQVASMDGLTKAIFWPVLGMLLALLSEFAIAPRIVARENLALWHSVGSGRYLAQWLVAGVALFKNTRK